MKITQTWGKGLFQVSIATVAGVLASVALVSAATTISTNISTGGTLTVTGASTMANASTTVLSANFAEFGGTATTTFALNGAVTMPSTLSVTGKTTLGNASSTVLSANYAQFGGTATTTFAVNGTVTMPGAVTISGTASTTAIMVGSDQVSTVSGMIFGYCNIAATALTASTTSYVNCTGATGVTSSYRVFIQATSSMPGPVIVQAASSTGTTGTLQLQLLDTGLATTTSGGIPALSVNFWAIR